MSILEEKYENLVSYLESLGSVAVAFSGGVDSTFLLAVSKKALGDKAIAVTAKSIAFPEREHQESEEFCKKQEIKQVIVTIDQMAVPGFKNNPPDRCYLCKKEIFESLKNAAKKEGISNVAEGSNTDDTGDYRPGMRAISELSVLSPLKEADLSKEDIRKLSKKLGLPTWNKPSYACLATRFVYGEEITDKKIAMVDKAEQLLIDLGFIGSRCRIHGNLARIEVRADDMDRFLDVSVRSKIADSLKEYGFNYVSLDLTGYRTGSMNEVLPKDILNG